SSTVPPAAASSAWPWYSPTRRSRPSPRGSACDNLTAMARRAAARRIAAVLGVALLVAGVVLAAVLLAIAPRYRDRHVDDLARGGVGCTTPLEFTRTGTFYVFEEVASRSEAEAAGCPANPQPGDFRVELRRDGDLVDLVPDTSASYDS